MKIIIFGATGDVGHKVVEHALSRGHQVTAVGRSDAKLATLPNKATTIIADLDDEVASTAGLMNGHDFVISALRPDVGQEAKLVDLTRIVLAGADKAGIPIVIIGGAALLKLTDGSGHSVLSSPNFLPDAVRPIAEACAAQDALLDTVSEMEWTCIRPPAMLISNDITRPYAFGTDTLVTDNAGLSQISYADFAAALLDVAENRDGFARRVTVAWTAQSS